MAQLPLQLFFALWAGGFFGGLLSVILPAGATVRVGSPFVLVGIAVLVLFPAVTLAARWLNYGNTIYRVYSDRIEIEEGFLTQHRKEILLASVREINLRRGILQRLVGLGSIYLATPATGQGPWWSTSAIVGGTSTFGSGAMLMDLANPNIAYEQLRELVERARPTGPTLAT
ncbi:PH domain-containing protein [Bradyrhizobium sp. i1.15.2]|uniref:PH domain-containing protein n=1 Tax=Bradyrhizobium sp. i1.15.2 TaxID=3156362 RepID=UPI003396CB00